MCIGATGFMEDDFMSGLTPAVKKMFRAKRYMDDILILYVENENWDHERFLADFESTRSECYHPPLELEDGAQGTFLETTFEWKSERWAYRIKNENRAGEEPKVWRYKQLFEATAYEVTSYNRNSSFHFQYSYRS